MVGRRIARCLVATLVMGCTVSQPASPSPSTLPPAGGTLRLLMTAEGGLGTFWEPEQAPIALDPQLDGLPAPFDTAELMRCCLARTLLSTNGRSVERGGSRLHPDVAESTPEISADGLRWTFRIRPGLHYAPPLDGLEITAGDFVRSLHRLLAPRGDEGPYGANLYTDIVGAQAYLDGGAPSISGIESPDDRTLIINLIEPAGDLAARLATSLVAPIPPHPSDSGAPFGIATGHDEGFGGFYVSLGPYMLEGGELVDFALPADERVGAAAWRPGQSLTLVRNPAWDAAADPMRPALPDRIELRVVATVEDALGEVVAGRADLLVNSDLTAIDGLSGYGQVMINQVNTVTSIGLNIARPPIDDIHVRRAISHIVDRRAFVEALGGPLKARVAHHLAPEPMLDNLLIDYRPYGSRDGAPDVDAARQEMAQSRHDADGDGYCDTDACRNVRVLAFDGPEWRAIAERLRDDVGLLGIELAVEYLDGGSLFETAWEPTEHVAILVPLGWGTDFLSASSFLVDQFHSRDFRPTLVGATEQELRRWGYDDAQPINVDARLEACLPLTGAPQFECWAALDQHLMENVVSFVPHAVGVSVVLAGSQVVGYEWDELAGAPAYDQIRLAPP